MMSHSRAPCSIGTYSSQPEIADVGDAAGDDGERPDLDLPPVGEREALVGDVIGGDALQDVAGPRAPHPQGRPGVRLVVDLRRAVLRQVVLEPLEVATSPTPRR